MPGLFEVLALRCDLTVSIDEIDDAWRSLSREHHPDRVGKDGVDISTQINEARAVLSKPTGLLAEWLQVKSGSTAPRNAALSEGLMQLFSRVGDILREADAVIEAMKKAQTALAKSLLMPRALTAQKAVQKQLGEIGAAIEAITARFPEFEKAAEDGDFQEATAALGELKFLDKWQRECQQRLLELIAID